MSLLHDNHVLTRRHSFSLAFPVCFPQTQMNDFSQAVESLPGAKQPLSYTFSLSV